MPEEKTYPFRIHYKKENGQSGIYYIRETNAGFAVTAFLLRTGNSRESIVSVEISYGRNWERVL